MQAIIFGEISMDIIIHTNGKKKSGSVLRGESYVLSCGGHGANQAMAISRLGVKSAIVGRLGEDLLSRINLENLIRFDINTDGIFIDKFENSGLAILAVDENRDFQVVSFVEGVNKRVDSSDLDRFKFTVTANTKVAVFQLGYPINIVMSAMEYCFQKNIITVLDPTPVLGQFPDEIFRLADYILPNQEEAEKITKTRITNTSTAFETAKIFHDRGSKQVIIKLGENGVVCSTKKEKFHIPAYKVNTVDTIGAGDAFIGGLVAGIVSNVPLEKSVTWGIANAALCCSSLGAQAGLPTFEELSNFISSPAKSNMIDR
jgi:ribokinase